MSRPRQTRWREVGKVARASLDYAAQKEAEHEQAAAAKLAGLESKAVELANGAAVA
jgi:hypothetical protein